MHLHRIHTVHSARRGLMLGLGSALLACTLVIGAAGSVRAGEAREEGAIRALGDTFAKAFVQKNAELRASLFAEDATFVTPPGDFLQGRTAMENEFGLEAKQAVNGTTRAAFSDYRFRFIKPDVAVVEARPTLNNVNGPKGAIIPLVPGNFFFLAVRPADPWLLPEARGRFAAPPPPGLGK